MVGEAVARWWFIKSKTLEPQVKYVLWAVVQRCVTGSQSNIVSCHHFISSPGLDSKNILLNRLHILTS